MTDQNRAIVPNANQAIAITDPAMQDFAAKLKLLLPNGAKLSDTEALAGAQYAKTTGLDPFRGEFYVVSGIGVVPGYKGIYMRQNVQGIEPDYRYRPLTEDEKDWHDIQPGDKAVVCYATEPAEAAAARKENREPRVWDGVGIVRKTEQWVSYEWRKTQDGSKNYKFTLAEAQWKERANPPTGRSWGWVAQNRALKDCANHMGIPVPLDAETILAQAEAAGVPVELPITAELSAGQAEAAVAQALRDYGRQAQPPTPAELQAKLAANVTTMRGPKTADPFGIDSPPSEQSSPLLASQPPPNAPADWNALEGDLQRRAAAIRARILEHAADAAWKIEPDSAERVAAINRGFGIAFQNQDNRHALREYLLGHDSAGYTKGEVAVLLGWLDITKDSEGHFVPSAACLSDAVTILAALTADDDPLPAASSEADRKE